MVISAYRNIHTIEAADRSSPLRLKQAVICQDVELVSSLRTISPVLECGGCLVGFAIEL